MTADGGERWVRTGNDEGARTSDADGGDSTPLGPLSAWFHEAEMWVLLDGSRVLVAALLSAAVFVGSMLVWRYGLIPQHRVVEGSISSGSFSNGFASLQEVTADVVVLVLAINQLVVSPELGSIKKHRQWFSDVLSYRKEVEGAVDQPEVPTHPSAFLQTLLDTMDDHATQLRDAVDDSIDDSFRENVDEYARQVHVEANDVLTKLDGRHFGDIGMYRAAWDFETTTLISQLRGIRNAHDDITDDQSDAIDDLLHDLKLYEAGREYFATVYVQSEFVSFTRALLATGLIAFVTASYGSQLFRPAVFPGSTLGVRNVFWLISAAYTVVLVPYTLLISYVARLVTITKQTLFIGPFVPAGESRRQTVVEDSNR